ncbi:MAG: hypothetical protein LBJ63_11995 [Prevotellaceae bacterium]|jgi:hypothetical protein|nr:hypothetical protein [Prevotellaceae bacterium]
MKKLIKTLVLLVFICRINSIAQIPKEPTAALSPNAASMEVYGDIPVSLYTGTPEISIPLYDITVKDFTLPVSLSYHAAGIRIDQRPGWTGLGWTLFAGGAVTRSVNSMPDELNYSQGLTNAGYYYNHNSLNVSNWNTQNFLVNTIQNMFQTQHYKDYEPDEFSFNFAGYSGKFYLDHKGNWVVQCNKPVKVELDPNLLLPPFFTQVKLKFEYPCFKRFTITTEDGIKYVFGGDINTIDFSLGFFNQDDGDWVANTWYLTTIILPSTEEINFTYERNEFNSQMYFSAYYMGIKYGNSFPECFVPTPVGDWYNGKLIAPVYLKKITTAHATVTFEKNESVELNYGQEIYDYKHDQWKHSTSIPLSTLFLPLLEKENPKDPKDKYPGCLQKLKWYKLDNIKITENNSISAKIIKIINFNYSNSPSQRLTLNSIKESGKPPYTFSYHNIENLPGYLANKSDHWGFYNGTVGSLNYYSHYDSKNPNPVYTKYGVLTKITYPAGGFTEFEFEPHNYRKQLQEERWQTPIISYSSSQLAGGIRIKRIKNSTAASGTPTAVKEYYYVSDYLQNGTNSQQSSGVLGGQIKYYFDEYLPTLNNSVSISVFSSNSVLPSCQNISGNHIGYTEVIEKMADNSFVRHQFTNFDNGYMDLAPEAVTSISRNPYEPCNSKAMDRGLPILKEYYSHDSKKLKSLNIEYGRAITQEDDYVRSMKASKIDLCNTASYYIMGSTYKIFTNLLNPEKETETYYDANTGQALQYQETTYAYNSKKLLSEIGMLGSDGKRQKTKLVYPFESNEPIAVKMTNKNMLSHYIEKITYLENGSIISGERIKYNEIILNPEIIKPELVYLLETPAMIDQDLTAQFKPATSYKYNNKGNIIEIKSAGNQIPVAYLWGYKNQYPIAEIKNATYQQVSAVLGNVLGRIENANIPAAADLGVINSLRNTAVFPNVEVSTYTYKPLIGIETVTYPNGIKHFYEYDLIGRLRMIRDGENNTVERYKYRFAE